ncbi:conserved hypothetical protein [Histoplasma capsulatum var. duboisii H88]|uniref:HNH nuclease domain-containing protein n=1 Tax=Ajellomyces capsulatus (strain H88) TaxID=544711 RepID=F0UDF6_AJEC8|nr:conserved hypothetical protein [Histoplasma capsulatum var. duboisii H88]QSS48889.1 hypothetical protein I7I53_09085 [Histoplasma capsulatum var. duboisii H88]
MASIARSKPTGTSLGQVLDFSVPPLTLAEQAQADDIFNQLITYCEPLQRSKPYKKVTLVRLTYEHSRSKSVFLQQIFTYFDGLQDQSQGQKPTFEHGLSKFLGFSSQTVLEREREREREAETMMDSFAEHLFDNFFLPMKAVGAKTPQPTSASLSAPPIENAVGTPARSSTLRRDCLARDHNRCVVTRAFNLTEAIEREKQGPSNFKDDDGLPLEHEEFALLEVAHIIPHSIMSASIVDGQPQLSESKKIALSVLNMFNPGIIHLIEGLNIDQPSNALTLTTEAHSFFGSFDMYFESMDDYDTADSRHTYTIRSFNRLSSRQFRLPVTRTLLLSPNHTIDPPSPELLALHRSIAIILHLSAAGQYIEKIIDERDQLWARNDGSTELGHIVSLGLAGWLDGLTV